MARSLKAELLKLTTTRAMFGLLLGEIGVVVLSVASTVMSAQSTALDGAIHGQVFFLLVSINVGIFSLIVGMRAVTDEFRHGTIAHAFLSDPRRGRTVVAKTAAAALAAAGFAVASAATMVAVALPLASAKGGSLTIGGATGAIGGFVAANALWAVIGVGIGFVVRQQVPAMVGGIVWVLVVENLGAGFLGDAGRYLPGQAAYALGRALDATAALDVTSAGAVMALYAVVLSSLGLLVTRRRDVM